MSGPSRNINNGHHRSHPYRSEKRYHASSQDFSSTRSASDLGIGTSTGVSQTSFVMDRESGSLFFSTEGIGTGSIPLSVLRDLLDNPQVKTMLSSTPIHQPVNHDLGLAVTDRRSNISSTLQSNLQPPPPPPPTFPNNPLIHFQDINTSQIPNSTLIPYQSDSNFGNNFDLNTLSAPDFAQEIDNLSSTTQLFSNQPQIPLDPELACVIYPNNTFDRQNPTPPSLAPVPLKRIKSSPRGDVLEIYPMEEDLIIYWDKELSKANPGRAPNGDERYIEMRFEKGTYVTVKVGGNKVYPYTTDGSEWLKGQTLFFDNCQNPKFQFFRPSHLYPHGKSLTTDPFVRPKNIRTHLVSSKCPAHRYHRTLIKLCQLQLDTLRARANTTHPPAASTSTSAKPRGRKGKAPALAPPPAAEVSTNDFTQYTNHLNSFNIKSDQAFSYTGEICGGA